MEPFKLNKRAFTDLLSADNKKEVLRPLQIPQYVKQFLVNIIPDTYTTIFLDVAPSQPSTTQQPQSTSQPPTSAPVVSTSQSRPKSKTKPTSDTSQKVPVVKSDTSSRPKTSRPKSVAQSSPRRKRRLILRDESDEEEQVQVPASELVTEEA